MNAELYVDFENVQSGGLKSISQLRSEDIVNIIYSKNADRMGISEVREIMKTPAHIVFTEAHTGTPNALDFQLLAIMFLRYPDEGYEQVIVSRDTGYDSAVMVAAAQGSRHVRRVKSIADYVQKRKVDEASLDVEEIETIPADVRPGDVWSDGEYVFGSVPADNSCEDETHGGDGHETQESDSAGATLAPKAVKKKKVKKGTRIREHFASKGIRLEEDELSMIFAAVNETANKMQFYQYFQKRRGKDGIALYNRIKSEYDVITSI